MEKAARGQMTESRRMRAHLLKEIGPTPPPFCRTKSRICEHRAGRCRNLSHGLDPADRWVIVVSLRAA
eukprot:3384330-Rhodomonas_salina.1